MEIIKIDAENQKIGRLASKISTYLQGKNSPKYNPKDMGGNKVIVSNVSKLVISGNKYSEKVYHRHTGFMGHLKDRTFKQVFEKSPKNALSKAVYNMLPKNRLRKERLKKLVIN